MRKALSIAAILIVLAAAYLLLWPTPVAPVAWSAPVDAGYTGVFAPNDRLKSLQHLPLDGDEGPEHIVVRDEDGQTWVYAALGSGRIVRMHPDGSAREVVVRTGGRPLGFDFDADGALIIADPMWGAHGGLLRVTGRGDAARVELLADTVDHPVPGDAIRYADAVVVARDGRIYFTDASRRFAPTQWGGTFPASVLDAIEHSSTGRLLEYDPQSRGVRVLLSDLCFANGLALAADEQHVFVAETCEYRIWKVALGKEAQSARAALQSPDGGAQVVLANLPGFPDNLMRGRDGRIWAGLVKPRGRFIDDNAGRPWLRKIALRLPKSMWPVPPSYGHVLAFDESGRVLIDLQDPTGNYPGTTAVTETAERLYVQSLQAHTLGWLPAASMPAVTGAAGAR
jgi:sugar lactone lactonase YvrE